MRICAVLDVCLSCLFRCNMQCSEAMAGGQLQGGRTYFYSFAVIPHKFSVMEDASSRVICRLLLYSASSRLNLLP